MKKLSPLNTEPKELQEDIVSSQTNHSEVSVINFVEDYIDGDIFNHIFSDNSIDLLYTKFKGNILAFLLHKYRSGVYKEDIESILEANYSEEFKNNFIKLYNLLKYKYTFDISNSPEKYIMLDTVLVYIEDESSLWFCNVSGEYTDPQNYRVKNNEEESDILSAWHEKMVNVLDDIGEIYEEFILDYDEYKELASRLKDKNEEETELNSQDKDEPEEA